MSLALTMNSAKPNVCRLHQAIVGLKQAPRAWFAKLEEAMQTGGFRTKAESALFIKKTERGLVLALVYVDDIIVTGSDAHSIALLKDHLKKKFEIQDLG